MHGADLADDTFDAPIAAGLDAIIRGISLTSDNDHDTLVVTDRIFDGRYEHVRRELLSGRSPA